MENISFITTNGSEIDRIKELWEGLNNHHFRKSINFKERYKNFTFEKRKEILIKKVGDGEIYIELAIDNQFNKAIGYCMSVLTNYPEPEGEVESLYIDSNYRGKGIGEIFMKHAIEWLNSKNIGTQRIVVACGNEEVLPFYLKFGFYPKFMTLEKKI